MEKCFDFVIHIYDENNEKRYYGTGEIVAREGIIDGYVCNDYLLINQRGEEYDFSFYNKDMNIEIFTTITGIELEFPGNYDLRIPDGSEVSRIILNIGSEIKDFERCKEIKETLNRVKEEI